MQKKLYGPHLWQIRVVRDVFMIALVLALLNVIRWLWPIFMPIFVALLLAYLFNPTLHKASARWNMPRPLTAGLIIAVASILVLAFFVWLWPIAAAQAQALAERMPTYINTLASRSHIEIGNISQQLQSLFTGGEANPQSNLVKEVLARSGRAYELVKKLVGATSYVMLLFFLIPLYFFFFAWHFDAMLHYLGRFIPESQRAQTENVLKKMDHAASTFFRGRVLVSIIVAVLYSVGWLLADVPYWFILGTLAGALNIIPFASGILWPVAVLVKYMDALNGTGSVDLFSVLLWPTLVFLVVQFLEGWVLSPWVQSDQMDMNAATVLIVVFVGGEVAGFFGLLLAIPLVACVKIFFKEVLEPRLLRQAQSP